MKGVRERVAARLEQSPALSATGATPLPDDVMRLHQRMREMVRDATRKGERVSAAAERASRSAERFMRRLEEELHEVEGLVVRLGPAEPPADARGARSAPPARSGSLRLLEPGAPEGAAGEEGGAAEREEPGSRDREEHS
jgi:hypothetical protein